MVPGGTALVSKDGRTSCISIRAVRGREPSLLDLSIGDVEPLSENQVSVINQDLNERYATIDSPLYIPPAQKDDSTI